MAWLFVAPLGIALVVTYILTNSSDEIAYLSAIVLLVSLVLSLIFAPWQIQGVLLLLLLLSNKRFLTDRKSNEVARENSQKQEKHELLHLSYRGINYEEATPPEVEITEGEIAGKYRGQVWKQPQLKNAIDLPLPGEMKYRGASCAIPRESHHSLVEETSS